MQSADSISIVLHRHTDSLMAIPGVLGTAEGIRDGRPCILILVRERTTALSNSLPSQLDGYPVHIQVVGEVKALE